MLCLPALWGGLALDDHVLKLLARDDPGIAGFHANRWFLFSFTSGSPRDNLALMDAGALLPWWSDPGHLNAFFRPLSSLTHVLDFSLWPDSPWLMHLHSLFWFAALMGTVAHHYRLIGGDTRPAWIAGLAFALFAFDEGHGMTVGWIANRNALISATFALPALGAHHRYRSDGWRPGAWLGPACFALGLCAGETAVGVFGYLLAHALVLERPRKGLVALWPFLSLLLAHRLVFAALHLGSAGSGAYHDPLAEPLGYALSLAQNLPLLLSAELVVPIADLAFWGSPAALPLLVAFAVATLLAFAWLARGALRDPVARFWGTGMALSACAVAASVPGERLLLVPSIGGAALLAAVLAPLLEGSARAGAERALLLGLAGVHLVASPLSLPMRAASTNLLRSVIDRVDASLPADASITGRHVVVLAAPVDVVVSYLQVRREARGAPRPATLNWLASASSQLRVERTAERTLRVRSAEGFLRAPIERHYRGDPRGLPPGTEVKLSAFTARVVEATDDGRPAVVDFELTRAPDDPRYLFCRYEDGRLLETPLPAIGKAFTFRRADFFELIVQQALRW